MTDTTAAAPEAPPVAEDIKWWARLHPIGWDYSPTGGAYINTIADYDVRNQADLQRVKQFASIREFPAELMAAFKEETENVLDGVAADDARFAAILAP